MKYILMLLVIMFIGCSSGTSTQEKLAKKGYTFIVYPNNGNTTYSIYKDSTNSIWLIAGTDISRKILVSEGDCEPCPDCKLSNSDMDDLEKRLKDQINKLEKEMATKADGDDY